MRVAIMQPYLYPYAGYFRLFATADVFVFLDDVQFNRRGRVHRTQLTANTGKKEWFTLPIKKTPRETTRIRDLEWVEDANARISEERRRFPPEVQAFLNPLSRQLDTPNVCITSTCLMLASLLGVVKSKLERSSKVETPSDLRGQDRIIHLCKHFGATTYVNSPGGTALYDKDTFTRQGIKLEFLPPYRGSYASIIERFIEEPPAKIAQEIRENICAA